MEIAKTIAPVCLAIIMFGLGLGLTTSDFTRLLKKPRDFFVGFLSQVILLPVIAFGLILIIPMPIEIAMGVMIIAAAPGGVTSNVLTKFANGDVALSVCLTAVVSLLAIFIVPLVVFNSADFLGIEITKEISMLNIVAHVEDLEDSDRHRSQGLVPLCCVALAEGRRCVRQKGRLSLPS